MTAQRLILFAVIVILILLLGLMGAHLLRELRVLSTAGSDNRQWTILQIDTEFANLSASLYREVESRSPDSAAVRLRTDIALSRLNLIETGQSRQFFSGNAEAEAILRKLEAYAAQATEIIDRPGDLARADMSQLIDITDALRPDARRLAVLGLSLGAEVSEARRAEFAGLLRQTGLVALALIAGLTAALFYLDRLLLTARRQDADLKATTERLTSTVAASLDGIIIANEAGEIVDYNQSAASIFGWLPQDIIGRKLDETIVPHQHRAAHADGMVRYLSTGEPHVIDAGRIELAALRKTGEEFPIELSITSARREDGQLFIAYLRDISEQKINEQKLIDARDQAERTDRAKSQFLTIMSHEMRTPLNGILGVLDLLKTTDLTGRQDRFVQVAAASGEILLEHVNEALDITRIETGAMMLSPQPFSMVELVQRNADVLKPLASEKGLYLNTRIDPNMGRDFVADGGRITQILTNLIGNGVKFTETGGISVSVTGIHGARNTVATFSVTDTGRGIGAAHLEDIFEDFVVLARSEGRQSRGDGLGLSISRKVARLMGGDLKAESAEGKSSTFTLTLPLERAGAKAVGEAEGLPRLVTTDTPSPRSILIVEDNAINRSVLREMLEGFGHSVVEARTGLEGLKVAEDARFDLIVMDISMPIMDGIEAARRIREGRGPNRSTYILGLTAHGREEYRTKASAAGMDGFCTKPIRLSVLRDTLAGIESDGPKSPQMPGPIAEDVVEDLVVALGRDKTRETADKIFREMADGVGALRSLSPTKAQVVISDTLHKIRGAAALLGLRGLAKLVDRASAANHASDAEAFGGALDDLESMLLDAAAGLGKILDTSPSE